MVMMSMIVVTNVLSCEDCNTVPEMIIHNIYYILHIAHVIDGIVMDDDVCTRNFIKINIINEEFIIGI